LQFFGIIGLSIYYPILYFCEKIGKNCNEYFDALPNINVSTDASKGREKFIY